MHNFSGTLCVTGAKVFFIFISSGFSRNWHIVDKKIEKYHLRTALAKC